MIKHEWFSMRRLDERKVRVWRIYCGAESAIVTITQANGYAKLSQIAPIRCLLFTNCSVVVCNIPTLRLCDRSSRIASTIHALLWWGWTCIKLVRSLCVLCVELRQSIRFNRIACGERKHRNHCFDVSESRFFICFI